MHELGIAESILTAARHEMALHQARSVSKIGLRIGPLSGVQRESLEFCFGAIIDGTDFAATTLEIVDGTADELEFTYMEVEQE